MKRRTISVWLLAGLWLVLGCKNGTPPLNNVEKTPQNPTQHTELPSTGNTSSQKQVPDIYRQAAIETCVCMQPMIEKAILLKKLEESNQTTEMKIVANEMVQLKPQIQKCSDEINQKYKQIKKTGEENRIYDAIIEECPDIKTLNNMSKKQ
jgi:PBP1b-binding outer membrane lipoprotein LpoB